VRETGCSLGAAAPRRQCGYVLAMESGFALIDEGATSPRPVGDVRLPPSLRMNDGKCDHDGSFWAGSMARDIQSHETGALYRLWPDGRTTLVLSDVKLSNGIDWSPDGQTVYYIDSLAEGVDACAVDQATGGIRSRRRLVDVDNDTTAPVGMTVPDGLTVDADGNLWVAVFGAGAVRRYTPDGRLTAEVRVPIDTPTSCAFGGAELRDLFITSGGRGGGPHLFRCRPDVAGRPTRAFAG
jgi:sugar lactone lactonase YvrE